METRIVVIDDEESMRDLFTESLERQGWQVFSYPYDRTEFAALELHRPDLIILDIYAQDGGQGWEFLQLLKMDDHTARIPILITTIDVELPAEVRGYLLTRHIAVIRKPLDLKTLVGLVEETLLHASQAHVLFSSDRDLPILLVDDREVLRDNITVILSMEGYSVVTAGNGLIALDAISRAEYCLILLDISMPVMDGFEFMAAYGLQLRPHAPVIILSAETGIETSVLPWFVVGVLPKPFDIIHFLNLVAKYAQRLEDNAPIERTND